MNLKSLIPVGRQRGVARADNPFFSLQREIDRLFDDFSRVVSRASARSVTA